MRFGLSPAQSAGCFEPMLRQAALDVEMAERSIRLFAERVMPRPAAA